MITPIVILNEREWCERVLKELDMGRNASDTLRLLGRYFYSIGCTKKEIARNLEDFVIRCRPKDSLNEWQSTISWCVQKASKRALLEIDGVIVTHDELEMVRKASGRVRQRVLFTMLCLAKFYNIANRDNNSWVNLKLKDIFSLANVKLTYTRQISLIHDLLTNEFIQLSKSIESMNIRVPWTDSNGEQAMFVADFRNLGNQYMKYVGEGYIECESCGLVVKRHSNCQIYCSECAAIEHRARVIEKYYARTSEDPYSLLVLDDSMARAVSERI